MNITGDKICEQLIKGRESGEFGELPGPLLELFCTFSQLIDLSECSRQLKL